MNRFGSERENLCPHLRREVQFELRSDLVQTIFMGKPKAVGTRGSWFAEVLGEKLPCIHDHWLEKLHYIDPGAVPGDRQWDEYIAAIREKQVVILTLDKLKENGTFQRTGYVATYSVANVVVTEAGLEMDLVQRLVDIA